MANSLKKSVQNMILHSRKTEYDKEYLQKLNEYDGLYAKLTEYVTDKERADEVSEKIERFSVADIRFHPDRVDAVTDDKICLVYTPVFGSLRPEAERVIYEFATGNPYARIMYGDEDYFVSGKDEYHSTKAPVSRNVFRYRKPVFSPETLCSFDYMGAIAVTGDLFAETLKDMNPEMPEDEFMYEFTFNVVALCIQKYSEKAIVRIPRVLTSREIKIDDRIFSTIEKTGHAGEVLRDLFEEIPLNCADMGYYDIRMNGRKKLGADPIEKDTTVSIIIPSKDNTLYLFKCIESLKLTMEDRIEVIVVDNGSSEVNRQRISDFLKDREFETKYIYEPMEFNYSKMNNIGAKEAVGDVLILLNDDIEADGHSWIKEMAATARVRKVGAVGCKLLYPDKKIQHVGIVGGIDGPSHKYMGEDDSKRQGFDENRINRNVLAVTGACLAVKTGLFLETGGLNEDLKVGYNDVDFCMTLVEKGYRNILLNDISLIHHESVSRGRDAKDKNKAQRLRAEKEILKKRHPLFMQADLFNGEEDDFRLEYEKDNDRPQHLIELTKGTKTATDEEGWVYSSFERFEQSYRYDGGNCFVNFSAKGYAVVPGIDNMRFDFIMLLTNEKTTYQIPFERRLRTDLSGRFAGTVNTELCGFDFEFTEFRMEPGEYDVKIYAKDHGNFREIITDTGLKVQAG